MVSDVFIIADLQVLENFMFDVAIDDIHFHDHPIPISNDVHLEVMEHVNYLVLNVVVKN